MDAPLDALDVESLVGSGKMRQGFNETEFNIKVSSMGTDEAVLQLVNTFDASRTLGFTLRLQKTRDAEGDSLGASIDGRRFGLQAEVFFFRTLGSIHDSQRPTIRRERIIGRPPVGDRHARPRLGVGLRRRHR